MMKTIIIFNNNSSKYADQQLFNGKSAKEKSAEWAKTLGFDSYCVNAKTSADLMNKMAETANQQNADTIIYAYEDCPFLNVELTNELLSTHQEYKAEYTFADGYPYGFAPEIIDRGVLNILAELAKNTQSSEGSKNVCRDSIFNLIKTDINSFDIESVLAPADWRLYRYSFDCGKKENYLQCLALQKAVEASGETVETKTPDELSAIAAETAGCLKTVPGFYNIQISDYVSGDCIYSPYVAEYSKVKKCSPVKKSTFMTFEQFAPLIAQARELSECAVIGLSAWGEAFANPECLKMVEEVLSYPELSVFIETDGLLVDESLCQQLAAIVSKAAPRTNGWQPVMVAAKIDAFSAETYKKIHTTADASTFASVVSAISKLAAALQDCVYPQFTRMNENEAELESFYRYWNEKTNPSNGNLIIQKYNNFAGLLPERKVADLAPLERNVCWHARRDMTILSNGDVPSCYEQVLGEVSGNVFEEKLADVWEKLSSTISDHICKKYNEKCRGCDEFYTFNF